MQYNIPNCVFPGSNRLMYDCINAVWLEIVQIVCFLSSLSVCFCVWESCLRLLCDYEAWSHEFLFWSQINFIPSFFCVSLLTRHGKCGFRQDPGWRKQICLQVSVISLCCCKLSHFHCSRKYDIISFFLLVVGALFSHTSKHIMCILREMPYSWDTERLVIWQTIVCCFDVLHHQWR